MKSKEKVILGTLIIMITVINIVNHIRNQRLEHSSMVIAEELSIKIRINSAGVEQLENLPGIGPHLADRIVQYRSDHGAFNTPEDLKKIKGIGDKMLEKIRPYILLK